MSNFNNKAMLLEISAFIADNNIRRGVLTTATNTQATDGATGDRSRIIQPSPAVAVPIECLENNKVTVFKCTGGPLTVSAKIGTNTTAIDFDVDSIWIMTSPVTELTVSNPGSRSVQLRILQA